MIQAAIFDADGMVLHREKRFSDRYAEDYGVPPGLFSDFFANEFQQCVIGKADLKEAIEPYLPIWKWNGTVDELIEYWFRHEGEIDKELIDHITELRLSGLKCYLATNNEKYRTEHMMRTQGLSKIFDAVFPTCEVGYRKSDIAFWQYVHERIGEPDKETVVVWDDAQEYVDTARRFGFLAYLYNGLEELNTEMATLTEPASELSV